MNITPLTPVFGAEIDGVDLSTLSDDSFDKIYDAWVEYGVLRFRGQSLTDMQLEKFSARFGPLEKIPILLPEEKLREMFESIYVLTLSNIKKDGKPIGGLGNAEAYWHSDMTYQNPPPPASVLYSIEIPQEGGNTQFACQHAALQSLSDELRSQLKNVQIKHDAAHTSIGELRGGYEEVSDASQSPGAIHPAVLRHPENGRDTLYLGRREWAYVVGAEIDASERLLDEVWQYAALPENVWTQVWEVGDVVIWDNRRVLHRRDGFPDQMRRLLKRCQVLARQRVST